MQISECLLCFKLEAAMSRKFEARQEEGAFGVGRSPKLMVFVA